MLVVGCWWGEVGAYRGRGVLREATVDNSVCGVCECVGVEYMWCSKCMFHSVKQQQHLYTHTSVSMHKPTHSTLSSPPQCGRCCSPTP